jgi:hypothetical protein
MDHVPGRGPTPGDPWRLTEADLTLVAAKPKRARLEFATLLLFFRALGRFPRSSAESAPVQLARVARQLGLVPRTPGRGGIPARTLKRYRAEIRALFDTRQAASNRREDHEISMLALHLLQNAMVYINTLMIQHTLALPVWANRLTGPDRRALTPLIWEHINPYGRFDLDMSARLALA